jgi:NADH dehydrogenase
MNAAALTVDLPPSPTHRAVIVGGGFAGLFAARALANSGWQVTLLDRRNFHTFQPLLYQVATGALTTGDIATPHRLVLRGIGNVRTLMSEVTDVDPQRRTVTHAHGALHYDVLIAATGVQHSYFGQDAWRRHAPGLKTLEHALEMRRRIFGALERAELEPDPVKREALMTFVVVGGGPTGVELAGAIGELTMRQMKGDFRRIDPRRSKILLVEAGPDVLAAMPEDLRAAARRSLGTLGVTVHTATRVEAIDGERVTLAAGDTRSEIETGTVLWAAGVQASDFGRLLARATGAQTDRAGRLHVASDLSLPDAPEIFVIGDLAHCEDVSGRAVPGLAPAAIQMGRYVAAVLRARRRGRTVAPFRYRDKGAMAVIGRNHAVGDLRFMRVAGLVAWWLWAAVHVWSLIQPEKRLRVFIQWAWRYFSKQTGDRLITGDRGA